MHVESVTLRNFMCFGPEPVSIDLQHDLTALIGGNGTGKTAVCRALQRVFGVNSEERTVRPDDFHVRPGESPDATMRTLSIEIVLAIPELDSDDADQSTVPDFYRHLAADDDGAVKCRLILESTWTRDGTIDGTVESRLFGTSILAGEPDRSQVIGVSAAERSRIQFVYVPASRDGARHVAAFLRGRLWQAAQWSADLQQFVSTTANEVSQRFHDEPATRIVEGVFESHWRQLHGAGTHATPRLQPLEPNLSEFLRGAEITFEPDHSGAPRSAKHLSDGQRSLLHLALTMSAVDIENTLATEGPEGFDAKALQLPALTLLAVEEPENNLSPFYLSRIVAQVLELGSTPRAQTLLSSHSASSLSRIDPEKVRHFRVDTATGTSSVLPIKLPDEQSQAGTYVREAVRAHPELYFAHFVVLGEGDSEQIVLPILARAMGIDLDPSFIAMVPLGGRHTQHFWRLLNDLGIPHCTLLDLDYGRAGGGASRLRTACANLQELGIDVLAGLPAFTELTSIDDDTRDIRDLIRLRDRLRRHGVFFSTLLDLDMVMLSRYWNAYTALEPPQRGPGESDPTYAVLGTDGEAGARSYWKAEDKIKSTAWYRYLFSNRSKPATHLRALSTLSDSELGRPPHDLRALLRFIQVNADL